MRAPLIVLIVIFSVSVLGLTVIPGQDAEGNPIADGLLRRLLRHELHRDDHRLRRDPVSVHLQPADVGDHLDLPDGDRLGLRHRVAARPAQRPRLPVGAGAAALQPQGLPAARAVPADRRLRAHGGAARALVRRARPAVRRPRSQLRAHRGPGTGLLPRRRARSRRRCARPRPPGRRRPRPRLLRGGRRPHRRRGGQPRHRHGGGAAPPRAARHRPGHVADDRRADAGVRQPEHGQPLRPVRRPPAPRPPGAGVLPAADLAGERPGRRAARARLAAAQRPLDRLRLRPAGPGADRPTCAPRASTSPSSSRHADGRRATPTCSWATAPTPGCWRRPTSTARSGWSRARTTTRRTCPWLLRPVAATRSSSSPPGRTARPVRRCSPRWSVDALLVPTEVVAHEVYAQLSTPLLWRFLRELPAMGNDWAAAIVDRLTGLCGSHLQTLWKVRLTPQEAPGARVLAGHGGGPPRSAPAQSGEPRRTAARDRPAGSPRPGGDARAGRRLRPAAGRRAAARRLGGRPPGPRHHPAGATASSSTSSPGARVPSSWIWRRLGAPRSNEASGVRSG